MIQPQGHSAAGKIMSMKNSNNTIANRTREVPACNAVPQPTVPPAACPFALSEKLLNAYQITRHHVKGQNRLYFSKQRGGGLKGGQSLGFMAEFGA
jgi:hypothetical protein